MSNIAETLTASGNKQFNITGRFVRLMNAAGLVEIVYYLNGSEIARTGAVQAGYAEEFDEVFDSFVIYDKSGAVNAVEILYRMNSRARYDRAAGNVSVSGGTLTLTEKVSSSYGSVTPLAANTAVQVVAPGANVNGIEVASAQLHTWSGGTNNAALIAKASAPANVTDGAILLLGASAATYGNGVASLGDKVRIPAGVGLYFISTNAEAAPAFRQVNYTIL